MENQDRFLELLADIKEIAKAQDGRMAKQEIQNYLSDMQMSEKQWEAVYQYLEANGIRVEGYSSKTNRAARNRYLYQMELQEIPLEQMEILHRQMDGFLQGEAGMRELIIEGRLHQVVEIAGRYTKRSVPVEDVIAEGNLGLLYGMSLIEAEPERYILEDGRANAALFLETLEQAVIQAIEQMIDTEMQEKDRESSMLAKTNLLHEAAKFLTEELGRVPETKELSGYTKIPESEIGQIMGLSEDTKRIASMP